jgi:two-component system OmpR family response regulator
MKACPKIMLVEDDESLGFLLKDAMESYGWSVALLRNGEKGLTAFHNDLYDLCVLDVMLPNKDGFELAGEIRKYNQRVPIVFLTARSQVDDRIRGFQIGADDYVCKPFSMEEFRYRIDAILKRSMGIQSAADRNSILKVSRTMLDVNNLTLDVDGEIVTLTHKECQLIQMFFRHAGKVIERDVFLKAIWEDDGFFVARSMDVFVSRVRKYLNHDPHLRIDNIRGVGYVLKVL